ncbi:MAG: SufD family Fe-S cluster assembly protein, partial [Gammaproteobacteria bacterium]|nr:SufD family Fe-S cluster assembly protein [Gammaproteobacteria bacterium]
KPELEIYADDVKCSHGATIGQLDESMLFYLRSRGIPAPMARAMLTHGFGQDIIERMELAPIKAFIADTLLDSLPHANELRSIMS